MNLHFEIVISIFPKILKEGLTEKEFTVDSQYNELQREMKKKGFKRLFVVRTTLYGCSNDLKTLKQRRNNVFLTSCVGWEGK